MLHMGVDGALITVCFLTMITFPAARHECPLSNTKNKRSASAAKAKAGMVYSIGG